MPKSPAMKLRAQADNLARDKCRLRGKCEAAGLDALTCKGVLQWCHIVERSELGIRWDEFNCLCMCQAHHLYYTYRPFRWQLFIREHFPIEWDFVHEHIDDKFDGDYNRLIEELQA